MPRLILYLDRADPTFALRFVRPDGTPGDLPQLRLITFANLFRQIRRRPDAAQVGITKCVIDTGSPLSLVPEAVSQFLRPGAITPLPFLPSTPPDRRQVTVAGGRFPFDLGEITLRLEDKSGGRLDVTVVAMFTRDGGRLNVPLTLGLCGGVLDGRVLRSGPDPAAPHGREWTLDGP